MTDNTQKSNGRPWTLSISPTTAFNEGNGSNGAPYMNFRADIETSRGIKNRFVSVFNTQRFPNLIEDVKAALAGGASKMTLRFEYDQGETVKILGTGYVNFRKAANDTAPANDVAETATAEIAVADPVAELPIETPDAEIVPETVAEIAAEPIAETADVMKDVVVEIKKRRSRSRKAA